MSTTTAADDDTIRAAAALGGEIPSFLVAPLDNDAIVSVYGPRFDGARLGMFEGVDSDGGDVWTSELWFLIASSVPDEKVTDALTVAARSFIIDEKDPAYAENLTLNEAAETIPNLYFWEAGLVPAYRYCPSSPSRLAGPDSINAPWADVSEILEGVDVDE